MYRKLSVLLFLICFFSVWTVFADPSERASTDPWRILKVLYESYPGVITSIDYDFTLEDWYLESGATRLYWAEGRLLKEQDIPKRLSWRAYIDYSYPSKIPDPVNFSPEVIASLNAELLTEKRKNTQDYNSAFFELLYDGATRRKIESQLIRFDYLGKRVSVHKKIEAPLKRVESRINILANEFPEVRLFIDTIESIDGYNWREVRDTNSRSNHSWGIAIDILPKGWGKKNIYWNWLSYWNDLWMLIPLDQRWMPPLSVIRIFEEEGFIWGGKWHLWDNMHFEYRPELLRLQKSGYN
ncbi:MAG TPA: M15 family metallopeptidase [Treponemataceae bacterium]|nr:M15 family metallopeptidase [Treponemataceae bacterium]